MTREDIIKWAQEAGFSNHSNPEMWGYMIASAEELSRFAALVAAAEREVCAKVCDEKWIYTASPSEMAEYIRARGNT